MQRVTICQDSMHLPSKPYVSFKIFEQIIYNQQQLQLAFYVIPSIQFHRSSYRVKCLKKSSYSSRQTPWKRCPKYSSLLHARETGNFGRGPVGCQIQQPITRVYEENDLQPGLNTSTYCS